MWSHQKFEYSNFWLLHLIVIIKLCAQMTILEVTVVFCCWFCLQEKDLAELRAKKAQEGSVKGGRQKLWPFWLQIWLVILDYLILKIEYWLMIIYLYWIWLKLGLHWEISMCQFTNWLIGCICFGDPISVGEIYSTWKGSNWYTIVVLVLALSRKGSLLDLLSVVILTNCSFRCLSSMGTIRILYV